MIEMSCQEKHFSDNKTLFPDFVAEAQSTSGFLGTEGFLKEMRLYSPKQIVPSITLTASPPTFTASIFSAGPTTSIVA